MNAVQLLAEALGQACALSRTIQAAHKESNRTGTNAESELVFGLITPSVELEKAIKRIGCILHLDAENRGRNP